MLDATATPDAHPAPLLVVEDSPSDALLLREALVDDGWSRDDVVLVESLRGARDALTSTEFAAILLDLTLGDTAGLEGVAVLATAAPEVPIVVVTAQPGDSIVVAALVEGADEFVSKRDLDGSVAGQAVRRAVGRRAGKRRAGVDLPAHAFDAVESPTVVLDGIGRIVATNRAWDAAAAAGDVDAHRVGPGVNYLHVCDVAAGAYSDGAKEAAAGIRAVLRGTTASFGLDYECPDREGPRWFSMRAAPLGVHGGGAVVTHLEITELKEAERRLQAEASDVAAVFDEAAPIYALVDASGIVRDASPATQYLFGFRGDEAERDAFARIDEQDLDLARAVFNTALREPGVNQRVQVRSADSYGRWHDLDLVVVNLLHDERVRAVVVTGSDVTAGRFSQVAKRLESRLLDRLPAAVVVADDRDVVVYWNHRAELLYGIGATEALGRPVADLGIGPVDRSRADEVAGSLGAVAQWEGDYDIRRADGAMLPVYSTVEVVADEEIGFTGTVATSIDITDRRQLETELAFAALHDPLTGLPNRRLFVDHLQTALARGERSDGYTAVLFIDLDRFKEVNDAAGHAAGDAVLTTVATYLTALIRSGDVVARLGGDEFVVCLENVASAGEAFQAAQRIQDVLQAPFRVDGRSFVVSASIGIALSTPGTHADALVRKADAAMYAAKNAGRHRVELFDDEMHESARHRLQIATELADALDAGQIEVFYQPEIGITTGALVGFEALVRWRHPDRGLIPPDEFIPAAEESGLIGRLGRYVLEESCRRLAEWRHLAPERDLRVAVNVSGRQLSEPDFAEVVRVAIAEAGIPAARICLEVTESALLDPAAADRALRALKSIGVLIAIDDFGTGYSSLSRLKRFPVDFLKIDRSFVDGIGVDPEDEVIVTSVVNLAHSLGLEVIAEGIETVEQLECVAALGCEVGQGWLWERAVDGPTASRHVVAADSWIRASAPGLPVPGNGPDSAVPIDARAAVGLLVHELAGPLTVLAGFAELLVDGDDPSKRVAAARAIERNARLARSALAVVADIAELDSGTLRLSRFDLALADVVGDAVALAKLRKGHDVTFDVAVAALQIDGDGDRLTSAVANLLANARKFSPPGSTVRVWTAGAADGGVALHVSDQGPGIPSDRVGVIFRKFGRVDHSQPGSGLGLYLARGVARAHGGDLHYRRAPGGGAEFVLELPPARSAALDGRAIAAAAL